jgi:glycosyltransferase involved in cell wall biosynthesis
LRRRCGARVKILYIHPNFPAQFVHHARALARRHEVTALSRHVPPRSEDVRVLRFDGPCAAALQALRASGYLPDAVIAHSGWGDALHVKDVFPSARFVAYAEFLYDPDGADARFDPAAPPMTPALRASLATRNAPVLATLERADVIIAPTAWQRSLFPAPLRDRITVLHDGIEMARVQHPSDASLTLSTNIGPLTLRAGDEVLTYVSRNLEPVRGFPTFMRALPALQRARAQAQVVIAGGDGNSYSYGTQDGKSWKARMLEEAGAQLDLSRVHFTGVLPYRHYAALLAVSKVHAYLTTPFVLSWSFLEAALAGVPLVASDTEPVREFAARLGVRLVDFFDVAGWSAALAEALAAPARPHLPRSLPELDSHACATRLEELLG